ncbi:MAG: tRNA (N6-isopentenyl adenosine(37)-C2)-methylthiotransferase MiaB, partial [candidate division Zixibacteria bacterium]|nr:tRNA (N6-isopentenyl adenosine(37)-C2)-methylthiotransferase MiaB [candidate division Zixibacteria bacterium]
MIKIRTYKIITFGGQMNIADSGSLSGLMNASGYKSVESDENADIIIINTCSVRQKAEERVFGRLGYLSKYKKDDNFKIIAVVGCMAQRMAGQILERAPYVDFILGTDQMLGLPKLLDTRHSTPEVKTELGFEETSDFTPSRDSKYSAYVSIIRGCNNFCTYCIVPYVRGRERSYSVSKIVN